MARILVSPLLLISSIGLFTTTSSGQNAASLTSAVSATAIASPAPTGVLGHLDAAAVLEMTEHRTAVGGLSWTGMQAAGQITYGSSTTSYPVTLSNFGPRDFRLDITTPKGITSTRISGFVGKQQESDGTTISLAIDNCLAGLFPFELVRAIPLQSPSVTLTEGGASTIGGVTLHRVMLERATIGRNPTTKQRQTTVIDLYFDPGTHLLVESRAAVDIGRNVKLISAVTYSDYRLVGAVKVPFHFNEKIDGQQYRSVQLSSFTLVPTLDPTLFTF